MVPHVSASLRSNFHRWVDAVNTLAMAAKAELFLFDCARPGMRKSTSTTHASCRAMETYFSRWDAHNRPACVFRFAPDTVMVVADSREY